MTKKAKAFELFDEGKTPISPEVKDLKLKGSTRYNYFYAWQKSRGGTPPSSAPASIKLSSGETLGAIDESRERKKESIPPEIEKQTPIEETKLEEPKSEGMDEGEEVKPEGGIEPEGAPPEEPKEPPPEKPKAQVESIGTVSEVITPKEKDGKPEEPERKIATTIADDGIKCTVFLSLPTLALYRIAASTQAQIDDGEELSLGDFLDTCAEDFFRVRGKKLGLISTGGK